MNAGRFSFERDLESKTGGVRRALCVCEAATNTGLLGVRVAILSSHGCTVQGGKRIGVVIH